MPKKVWLISGCLLVLVACFALWGPFTVALKKDISISSPIFLVSPEFTDLNNWKHWYPDLKKQDSTSVIYSPVNASLHTPGAVYTIINMNPAHITVRKAAGSKEEYESIDAFPQASGDYTMISWTKLVSPFTWLKERISPGTTMQEGLNNLKSFMEDPKQFYGFPISIEKVKDTLVITKITTTKKDNVNAALNRLYKEMFAYIQKNHISMGDGRMASFAMIGRDSIRIAAGIPVHETKMPAAGIMYLRSPKGRMLTGEYEGAYTGLKHLYEAMDHYVINNKLQKVAVSYEKYLTNPLSANDSAHMKIELCYPVY